jgi:hypothetical protein
MSTSSLAARPTKAPHLPWWGSRRAARRAAASRAHGDASLPSAAPERRRRGEGFPCDEPGCTHTCAKTRDLVRHKRTHERPHACDEPGCAYRAAAASDLARHKRAHSGELPHACDEAGCVYRASKASHLTVHKRTHSGERPHACDEPGCKYRAAEVRTLTVHKRTHSGERPHACDEPNRRLKTREPKVEVTREVVARRLVDLAGRAWMTYDCWSCGKLQEAAVAEPGEHTVCRSCFQAVHVVSITVED